MENEINIVGIISQNSKKILRDNGKVMYHFKIRVKRSSKYNINSKVEDVFNCMISEYVEYNPDKNLAEGNLVRIKGSLQSNKIKYESSSIDMVYIIVNHLIVESNVLLSTTHKPVSEVSQVKKVKSYNKNQHYSSAKPYHDNFPAERDLRNMIRCSCGNSYSDTLDNCPYCGRSAMDVLKKI
jgi:single-stranded DNA-binding protein